MPRAVPINRLLQRGAYVSLVMVAWYIMAAYEMVATEGLHYYACVAESR